MISSAPDLSAADAVARYTSLADIERGFRVLKSDVAIAPVHHRLPDRIRAHALICCLALVLWSVMVLRLKARAMPVSHSSCRACWARTPAAARCSRSGRNAAMG